MLGFSNFKIVHKLALLVVLLSIAALTITVTGVRSLGSMNEAADSMSRSSDASFWAIRLNTPLLAIDGALFRLIADPSETTRAEAAKTIATETTNFYSRADRIRPALEPAKQAELDRIRAAFDSYLASVQSNITRAQGLAPTALSAEATQLHDLARENFKAQVALRLMVRSVAETLSTAVDVSKAKAAETYAHASSVMAWVAGIGIGAGLLAGFLIGQFGIARPIRAIVAGLQNLAAGDYQAPVHGTARRDEIGDVARTAEVFRANLIRARDLERETQAAREAAILARHQEMQALATRFEGAVGSIVGIVSSAATEVHATAQQLAATAQQTSAQAVSVSSAAEEAGTNVASVASSAEELGASVSEIARQVERSSEQARIAVIEAEETTSTVGALSAAARRIDGIVEMIAAIAAQTNLLALNATIEAARAGEAGRGFAVVATEVKNLAEQTAKATSEISQQISSIQGMTTRSVEAISRITTTIRDINDTSASIASAVEQQGLATREIVLAVGQASTGTGEVTANITGVAKAAEETNISSSHMLGAASELASQAESLRHEVGAFLQTVRAA